MLRWRNLCQSDMFLNMRRDESLNLAIGDIQPILEDTVQKKTLTVALCLTALKIDEHRIYPANLLESLRLIVADLRCRKFVVYSPNDSEMSPCFLYTWDDFLTFVEREDVVARDTRKAAERRATTEMPPGEYVIVDGKGADSKMSIDDAGTCTLLAGSKLRQNAAPSIPQSIANFRNELQRTSKLVPQPGGTLELTEDVEVSSTSYAASAVYGRSASGPFSWRRRI